jgi:FAD/FMN-containing dehydrogenase
VLESYRGDQAGVLGYLEALARPQSTAEIRDCIAWCRGKAMPLLPVGLQSATTGAARPEGGLVLDLRGLAGVLDLDRAGKTALVLPGTVTADLKAAVAAEGLLYPPDPTSEKECTVGGNVASNASGARSFRHGMTRDWIQGVEVADGAGNLRWYQRRAVDKNTFGPFAFHDPVDLFVGSEGILGVITKVQVRLLDAPPPFLGAMLFFRDLQGALEAAVTLRRQRDLPGAGAKAGCVELLDRWALDLVAAHPQAPSLPREAQAALFTEWDAPEGDLLGTLEALLPAFEALGAVVDWTLPALTQKERELFRELRHHVPDTCNRMAVACRPQGGVKISTEFCVPPAQILEMMRFVEATRLETGLPCMVRYGHIGNGHPHIFMYAREAAEVPAVRAVAHRLCRRAVELGGTVAGEHGIGKSRRDFLGYMMTPELIDALAAVKRVLDPDWVLAPGNILAAPPGRSQT